MPVLVEGPVDRLAVSIVGAGRYVGLAPGGTALTEQHVAALARVVPLDGRQVLVALDSDEAGNGAGRRLGPSASRWALPDAVVLPPGTDPTDLAVQNPSRLLAALERPRHLEDLVVDQALAR